MVVVLAVALFPALAASKTTRAHIPVCSRISRTAMANLAQTGPLKLRKKIGPLCQFTGEHHGHYEPTFDLEIIPYISSIWNTAKTAAQKAGAKPGNSFGQSSSKLFFESGTDTSSSLPACSPGEKPPKYGPPACAGQPSWVHFGAYGNGTDPRAHARLMVAAAVSGQEGDLHLSHMLELAKEILSGKLR